MNRKIFKRSIGTLGCLFLTILIFSRVAAIAAPGDEFAGPYFDVQLKGNWVIIEPVQLPGKQAPEPIPLPSRYFFVHVGNIPEAETRVSYGGALNLKYFSGIAYNYLQKELPGKTIRLKVTAPESLVSPFAAIPNKLRVSLKSQHDGSWTEFLESKEWVNVKQQGNYDFKLKVPTEPVIDRSGNTYHPEGTILISVELYLMEGTKRQSSITFAISDIEIEGIDLNEEDVELELLLKEPSAKKVFLPSFPRGSVIFYSIGHGNTLQFSPSASAAEKTYLSGNLEDFFLTVPVFIPEELRLQKGSLALTLDSGDGLTRSAVKNFDSCSIEGKVYLTIPLKDFSVKEHLQEIASYDMTLDIKTQQPHTDNMMPFVIEPAVVRRGTLIPFDDNWRIRRDTDIQPDKTTVVEDNAAEILLSENPYQMTFSAKMKGGIDWSDPYYRIEIIRDIPGSPVNMDDMRLEVNMSPLTNTMKYWQKPFRARLALVDINGNMMFGPNISLSEGVSNPAILDVSITNPMPKGLVFAGFDPEKVRSIVINFEGSHGPTDMIEIETQLTDLFITPREHKRPAGKKTVNFDRFTGAGAKGNLSSLIKEFGGFTLGMNYPFPVLEISPDVLEVPQIYPTVGKKATDPNHLSFASPITKKTTLEDFTVLVEHDLTLIRLFLLGHLAGVFEWDEKEIDITGFLEGEEALLQDMAGMSVEKLVDFLNNNEEMIFPETGSGRIAGLQKDVMGDLTALLDILETVERNTGRKLCVIVCLYDFLLGDGSEKEGPLHSYKVGEHPEAVLNPSTKVKVHSIVWKMLKEWSKDERFHRYISIMEIMNEPGNATVLSTKQNFNEFFNFIAENLYLAKDAIGGDIPVSVGFRSWPADLRFWADLASGLDVLMIHYWESLESYNINTPGLWPLKMDISALWEYLGAEPSGRLTGMGEIGPKEPLKKNLMDIENAGYDFCLMWSYSGHDSYDARAAINKISEYQKGNRVSAGLIFLEESDIKRAFEYIINNIDPKKKSVNIDTAEDDGSGMTIKTILESAELKGIPFTEENFRKMMENIFRRKSIWDKK
ncbi:MAG: hypothetical protein WCV56_08085 [Candidatus Omnitrophota bacterium]